MDYTKLGRSTMSVSKICLGTMPFGPKASEEESHQILDRALGMGINFIDTANVYGGDAGRGRSEEIIGSWLAANLYRAISDQGRSRRNRAAAVRLCAEDSSQMHRQRGH
jgi:aryl-alcohol dehydrogenase-like predicted oxidoreductase